uniref:Uncharacterized protein n=1 Tax=Cannabis sativa TaxID=3483 RepID=A0A803QS05_CANSA
QGCEESEYVSHVCFEFTDPHRSQVEIRIPISDPVVPFSLGSELGQRFKLSADGARSGPSFSVPICFGSSPPHCVGLGHSQ